MSPSLQRLGKVDPEFRICLMRNVDSTKNGYLPFGRPQSSSHILFRLFLLDSFQGSFLLLHVNEYQ
jgi:hypothetical protein